MSEQAFTQPDRARSGRRKLYAIGALVACLGLFAWTIVSRAMTRVALREQTIATATPTGATIRPQHGPAGEELRLPAPAQAHNVVLTDAGTSGISTLCLPRALANKAAPLCAGPGAGGPSFPPAGPCCGRMVATVGVAVAI